MKGQSLPVITEAEIWRAIDEAHKKSRSVVTRLPGGKTAAEWAQYKRMDISAARKALVKMAEAGLMFRLRVAGPDQGGKNASLWVYYPKCMEKHHAKYQESQG